MPGIYLEPSIKGLPYEKMYDGECLLKEKKEWAVYQDGKATDEVQGYKYRCFYPELERSLWIKVKGGGNFKNTKDFPPRGIPVMPKGLRVNLYGTNKGGVEFTANADDIVPADSSDDDLLG